jgi:processive 1,2-diacylglycerol beta-glucosyltransferase
MKLLLVHATAGNGHKRAAEAIEAAALALAPAPDVAVIDALDFAPPSFKTFYQRSFEGTVKHAPWFFGALFRASSEAARFRAFRAMRRIFNRVVAHDLCDEVEKLDPDVVVCTHFLSLDALARRKRRRRLSAALATVVTDYVAHGFWAEPTADRTYAPVPAVATGLASRGVPRARIRVTGIPVDPAFAAAPPREEARAALGLDPRRRAILVLGGGLGMGPLAEIVEAIGARDMPVALEVVCGKNEELRARLSALAPRLRVPARIHGFVRNIPALMAASDLVVTKPGGLTTSEALAVGRPMLLFEAMPGQEAANAAHFTRVGAALMIEPAGAGEAVAGLLAAPERLEALAARARAESRPEAARAIAEDALLLRRTRVRRKRAAAPGADR